MDKFFLNRVRRAVPLIFAIFPLFALLPFLSFSVSLFLSILMVISNLICIQITSPGGTPIRGKNAGYRKCLLILLSSSLLPLRHHLCHLSVSPFPALCPFHLLGNFLCLYHITFQNSA